MSFGPRLTERHCMYREIIKYTQLRSFRMLLDYKSIFGATSFSMNAKSMLLYVPMQSYKADLTTEHTSARACTTCRTTRQRQI